MRTGVLMLHGFSGGPYEIEPLASYLQKQTDWVIEMPVFSGHGDAESLAMKGYKAQHWLMDAELAYRRLARQVDEVMVVGFSMGGVIALYLANRYPVKKMVLLSAAVKYVSPKRLVEDIRMMAVEAFRGKLRDNALFLRYEHKFRHVPLSSTIEFTKIVRRTEMYIHLLYVPVFIVQGEEDGIVPSITAQYLYDRMPSVQKQMYLSKKGKHHICYSDDCDTWFNKVYHFLSNEKSDYCD